MNYFCIKQTCSSDTSTAASSVPVHDNLASTPMTAKPSQVTVTCQSPATDGDVFSSKEMYVKYFTEHPVG